MLPQCALISLSAPITRSGCLLQVSWCLWLTVLHLHSGRSTCRTSPYSVPCLVCTLYSQSLILKRLGSHKSTGFRQLFFFFHDDWKTLNHTFNDVPCMRDYRRQGLSNRLNASNSRRSVRGTQTCTKNTGCCGLCNCLLQENPIKRKERQNFFPPSGFSTYASSLLFPSAHHCVSDIAPLFRRLRLVTQLSASHLFYVIGQWQIVLGLFVSWHDCTLTSHNSACRPPQLMLTGADQPPQCIRGKRRKNCCVSPDLHQY